MAYKIGHKMQARYTGICKVTGKPIKVNDWIVYGTKGWSLVPNVVNTPIEKQVLPPVGNSGLWYEELSALIGCDLADDFQLNVVPELVVWSDDEKKLIKITIVKNKVNNRYFHFGMYKGHVAMYRVIQATVQRVDEADYIPVEAIEDECYAMEYVVGDADEYYFIRDSKKRQQAQLKKLMDAGYAEENAWEMIYNGVFENYA